MNSYFFLAVACPNYDFARTSTAKASDAATLRAFDAPVSWFHWVFG